MFSIPRWINVTKQPEGKSEAFAERGFASVVRLVLRDEEAHADALGQFRLLIESIRAHAPVYGAPKSRLTALVEGCGRADPRSDRLDTLRNATSRFTAKGYRSSIWGGRGRSS